MKTAWDILAALVIVIFFMLLYKSDELTCSIGTHNVAAYNLCTATEGCVITYEATQDFIGGSKWIKEFCEI